MNILGDWELAKQSRSLLGDMGELQGETILIEEEMSGAVSTAPPAPASSLEFSSFADLSSSSSSFNNSSTLFPTAEADDYDDNYLEKYLGPKHLPFSSLIPITVIYTAIFVTGIFGNLSTCLVIAKAHYMRSSTNYYLFNLAIADMLTLIFGKPCLHTIYIPLFIILVSILHLLED